MMLQYESTINPASPPSRPCIASATWPKECISSISVALRMERASEILLHSIYQKALIFFKAFVTAAILSSTLWLFSIAMEHDSFVDDFPSYQLPFIVDFHGFSMAMLHKSPERSSFGDPSPGSQRDT